MEEYVNMNGTYVPLDIAVEITGLSEEELRKSKHYFTVKDAPFPEAYPELP